MMSRYYGMQVRIHNVQPDRIPNITQAAEEEWEFEGWRDWQDNGQTHLAAYGESSLCGGENEEEFTDRLAATVWEANGQFCKVLVHATYLEDLPCETHDRDFDDYQKFITNRRTPSAH